MSPVRFAPSTKGDRERRVFSSRRQRPLPPPWRQGLEGALMTLLGVGLLAFLVWLPERMDALVIVSEVIFQLIEGVKQLVAALLGFGSLLLIAAMLLAGLISLLGGVLGIFAGFAVSWMVALVTGWSTSVSLQAVLLAFAVSTLEGLIFGYLPARRAAQLQPAMAVRIG